MLLKHELLLTFFISRIDNWFNIIFPYRISFIFFIVISCTNLLCSIFEHFRIYLRGTMLSHVIVILWLLLLHNNRKDSSIPMKLKVLLIRGGLGIRSDTETENQTILIIYLHIGCIFVAHLSVRWASGTLCMSAVHCFETMSWRNSRQYPVPISK